MSTMIILICSAKLPSTDEPLRIGDNSTLRSYVTINRPQATSLHSKEKSSVSSKFTNF